MDIPCMSSHTFLSVQEDISQKIQTIAEREMKIAGEEEKLLDIESGSIDTDGTPMCTVSIVVDGQRSKRSYKTNYDALSGVVSSIINLSLLLVVDRQTPQYSYSTIDRLRTFFNIDISVDHRRIR